MFFLFRLEDEKAQIEKQKEYFAKLESEMQQEKSAKAKVSIIKCKDWFNCYVYLF